MRRILLFLAVLQFVFLPVTSLAQDVDPAFNPSKIIEDKIFVDTKTFGGPAGVQKFLESKGSILANTSPEFLVKLKEPTITILKEGLEDPQPNLGRLRTGAELIWDAAQSSGLNPQVILVTLNKEQSLITGHQNSSPEKLQKALDRAMGFDCPDATGCGNLFPGFYYQIFGNFDAQGNRYLGAAKSLAKSFSYPEGRGPAYNGRAAKVGDVITLPNTLGAYTNIAGEQTVMIGNKATAALYRYTPHVFNGNYNFWKFFTAWFRYPNGTLLKLANENITYIIQNGTRQLVPSFVAKARALDSSTAITVSENEIADYPKDKILGPTDNTVVQVEGSNQKYVFLNNVKRPASDLVLKQRGLQNQPTLVVTQAESNMFEPGTVLPPKDGTVLSVENNPAIYLVQNEQLRLFSSFTYAQRKPGKPEVIPASELANYAIQGYVAPLDTTLIKSADNGTVFVVENGLKRPITGEIFKNRGFSFKKIVTLSSEEVQGLATGAYATPKDKSFFKVKETNQLYIYKEGAKHIISSFVAKQRKITPDYIFGIAEANEWLEGIAIPPRDGTIVKGDKDATVYLVQNGQLKPLTANAFKVRKIKASQISVIAQEEVNGYAKGDILAK